MTWFFIALLVAVGGIWTAYARSKGNKAADPAPRAKESVPAAGTEGRTRIDANDPEEMLRWSRELGVDRWDLEDAIRDVGPDVDAVKKYLGAR